MIVTENFTVAAEVEVVADVDLDWSNPLVEHLSNEILRGHLREFIGEWFDDHRIDTCRAQQLDSLLDRRKQSWCTIGGQHLARVRIESVRHGLTTEMPRTLDDGLDDRTMPDVQTVEIPDGDHRMVERTLQLFASANIVQC